MGREIVYCWKCAKRLDGGDFERLKAYRYGDKVSCDECVFDLVGDLPAEEQEAILNGSAGESRRKERPSADTTSRSGGTTRTGAVPRGGQTGRVGRGTGRIPTVDAGSGTKSIPKRGTRVLPKVEAPLAEEPAGEGVDAAARKKKLILIGAGGGGLLLVVIVVLAILLMGGKKKPATTGETEAVAAKTDPRKPDPKASKEEAAKKAFEAAMAVFRDKPADLGAQWNALQDAELAAAGTSVDEKVKFQLEVLDNEVAKQLTALDGELLPLTKSDKFKAALELLDKAATTHNFPGWKKGMDKKLDYVKGKLEERFHQEKKIALEAKDNDDKAKVAEVVEKIRSWELADLIERLNKELGAVAAAPDAPPTPDSAAKSPVAKKPKRAAKPLSKDMQTYQPFFERALGLAFQRDFDAAMTEIRRAVKEIDSDETRKESGVDLDLLEKAKAWVEASVKAMPSTKRLDTLSLEIHDRPGEFKEISGKVTKVFDQRLEFRTTAEKDGKKVVASIFVEYADLTGRSLAEQVKKLQGKVDARMAGLLCLIEGNEDAAQALGGKEAEALPDRYWQHAPKAKESCPKSNGKEFEARNLFHAAEVEFREIATWGPAFEKYKTLTNEYSTTRIVQRNQATIVKRGQMGKEYVLNARNFKSEGAFKPARKPDLVLQGTKDVDTQEMKDNWVEAEFFALPNLTYRAWALIGGCCKETFGAYLQTSDRTTAHQGKQIAIDPGANMAEQLKMQVSGLKNDHAAHAPKDKKAPHPKDAARWEWVPIPLAKTYTEAGPKGIRLMTDQAGFAVKFIIVSSTRTKTPDPKETEEWVRALNEEPGQDDSGVKGTAEPAEWLLAGPFDESLNKVNPPERDIDLSKEMTGKGNKKFKWKPGAAPLQGGYVVFQWEDGKTFNPKDNVAAYALIHVKAPRPMEVQLSVGYDDGGKIWVNDESVHANDKAGGIKNDAFKAKATLEEGWNRILVKVRNGNGGWGFSMRILDDQGQPAADLRYSAYGDQLVPP